MYTRFCSFVILLLAVAAALSVLPGCSYINAKRIEREVEAVRQAASGELQMKRALVVSEASLQRLDRVDVAVVLPKQQIVELAPLVRGAVEAAPAIKSAEIVVKGVRLDVRRQEMDAAIEIQKKVGPALVHATVEAGGVVGGLQSGVVLNVLCRGIRLDKIELVDAGVDVSAVAALVNKALDEALGIVNVALDVELNRNPKRAVVAWLDQPGLIDVNTTDSNNGTTIFRPKQIKTALNARSTAVLIDDKGIVLLVKAEFVAPTSIPDRLAEVPLVGDLVEIDKKGAEARIGAYQAAVEQKLSSAFGADFARGDKAGLAVTREAVARAVNHALSQGPFEASVLLKTRRKESVDLTVEIKKRSCQDLINGCKFKDVCGDRSICQTTTVVQVADAACRAACRPLPNVGLPGVRNPRRDCEDACRTVAQTIVTPIHSAHCDAFIAWDNATGKVGCNAASNFNKATCDAQQNLDKSVCDIEQEFGRVYEHNPFATVESDTEPDVSLSVGVNGAALSSDLSQLRAKTTLSGRGTVKVGLNYVRRAPTDILIPGVGLGICTTNWKENASLGVSVQSADYDVPFRGSIEAVSDGTIDLRYELQDEQTIYINFSPSPMSAFFGNKPHLTLNCPVFVVETFGVGVGEALFTPEDARKAMPLFTGENYPYKLKNTAFAMRVPKVKLCKSPDPAQCSANMLVLTPRMTGTAILFTEEAVAVK